MKRRALLFDLDDTLYAWAPCNERGLRAAHAVLAREDELSFDAFRRAHDEARAWWARVLEGRAAAHDRALYFKRLVEEREGRTRPELVLETYEAYVEAFLAAAEPAPEAHRVLGELAGSYRLALVSNHTTAMQLRKVAALGFEPYFERVVTSEEVGVEKPDPAPFRAALEALGIAAEEAVMVGDDPRADVAGAKALGLEAVLTREFRPEVEAPQADGVLDRLPDLLGWLSRRTYGV